MTTKRNGMTAREIACMIEHGAHDWELYETRLDYAHNHVKHWFLWWCDKLTHGRGEPSAWFMRWRLHERCTHCSKTRKAHSVRIGF